MDVPTGAAPRIFTVVLFTEENWEQPQCPTIGINYVMI